MGRKITGSKMSLMNVAAQVGASFLIAFAPSNPAPMLIRATGVAQAESMSSPLASIGGKSTCNSENGKPARIPKMIGLLMIPPNVRETMPWCCAVFASGAVTVSTSTE